MKRAVNLRLDESVILTLNQLSEEMHAKKTEIIEKAICFFSKQNQHQHNQLLEFAGKLKKSEADKMLHEITNSKNSKDFEFNL